MKAMGNNLKYMYDNVPKNILHIHTNFNKYLAFKPQKNQLNNIENTKIIYLN